MVEKTKVSVGPTPQSRPLLYTLDAKGQPELASDIFDWGRWFDTHRRERIVAQTAVKAVPGAAAELIDLATAADKRIEDGAAPADALHLAARAYFEAEASHPPGGIISTVFLGLDHQMGRGPALLFETTVFGGPLHGEHRRYSTRDEALQGHAEMVKRAIARFSEKTNANG